MGIVNPCHLLGSICVGDALHFRCMIVKSRPPVKISVIDYILISPTVLSRSTGVMRRLQANGLRQTQSGPLTLLAPLSIMSLICLASPTSPLQLSDPFHRRLFGGFERHATVTQDCGRRLNSNPCNISLLGPVLGTRGKGCHGRVLMARSGVDHQGFRKAHGAVWRRWPPGCGYSG